MQNNDRESGAHKRMQKWAVVYDNIVDPVALAWQLKSLYEQNDPAGFFLFITSASPSMADEAGRLAGGYRLRHANCIVSKSGMRLALIREMCGTSCFVMVQSEGVFWMMPQYLRFLEETLSQEASGIEAFFPAGELMPASGFFAGRATPEVFAGLETLAPAITVRDLLFSPGSHPGCPFAQERAEAIESLLQPGLSDCRVHACHHEQELVVFLLSNVSKIQKKHGDVAEDQMSYGEFFYNLISDDLKRSFAAYLSLAEHRSSSTTVYMSKEILGDPDIRNRLRGLLPRLRTEPQT